MEYTLKNGKNIIIRKPALEDAEGIVNLISVADRETKFLSDEEIVDDRDCIKVPVIINSKDKKQKETD